VVISSRQESRNDSIARQRLVKLRGTAQPHTPHLHRKLLGSVSLAFCIQHFKVICDACFVARFHQGQQPFRVCALAVCAASCSAIFSRALNRFGHFAKRLLDGFFITGQRQSLCAPRPRQNWAAVRPASNSGRLIRGRKLQAPLSELNRLDKLPLENPRLPDKLMLGKNAARAAPILHLQQSTACSAANTVGRWQQHLRRQTRQQIGDDTLFFQALSLRQIRISRSDWPTSRSSKFAAAACCCSRSARSANAA